MRWLSAAVMLTLYTSSSWAFSIDDVAKQAQSLAGKGYEAPKSNLPSVFRDMKYADYQQIQFNPKWKVFQNLFVTNGGCQGELPFFGTAAHHIIAAGIACLVSRLKVTRKIQPVLFYKTETPSRFFLTPVLSNVFYNRVRGKQTHLCVVREVI